MSQPSDIKLHLERGVCHALESRPTREVTGAIGRCAYRARFGIPNYQRQLDSLYGVDATRSVPSKPDVTAPPNFAHFGIIVYFAQSTGLDVHNLDRRLHEGLRALVLRYGVVIARNVHLPVATREPSHRAIFPSLRFHVDRRPPQPDCFSLYTRDPFDPVQREPRPTSTLFLSALAACLRHAQEVGEPPQAPRSNYLLFDREPDAVDAAVGTVLLRQAWNEPSGTGEIALVDNRTVYHASYYRTPQQRGYKIGVRYLA